MCVHVFGGTSSPSFSNCALKRTSIDGKDQFGSEAAKILQNNFCVDDLKSVEQEDQTVQLIKNVKAMCSSGDFNLIKFLSNNKRVLQQSIPEEHGKKGAKDKGL